MEAGDAVTRVTRRNCVVKGMNRVVQYQGRQTASKVNTKMNLARRRQPDHTASTGGRRSQE